VSSDAPSSPATPQAPKGRAWSRRLATWAIVLGAVALLAWIGAAFMPRWWAHRVGDQANESFAGGILLGLFYGFVFTLLPIGLIFWGIRRRRSVRGYLFILGGAVLLALPNLFTLGIVIGRGNAAHAGDRTLDVEAPGFRGASLAGAIAAAAAIVYVWYLLSSRGRARAELRRAREKAKSGQAADAPVGDHDAEHADSDQGEHL
jgi:hypothetical protein